jgi:hypothetical protein
MFDLLNKIINNVSTTGLFATNLWAVPLGVIKVKVYCQTSAFFSIGSSRLLTCPCKASV